MKSNAFLVLHNALANVNNKKFGFYKFGKIRAADFKKFAANFKNAL